MFCLTDAKILSIFNITERTLSNWKRYGPPDYALERLSLTDGTHKHWRDFKILDGIVVCPSGETVTKSEISHYRWMATELVAAQSRASVIEKKLSSLNTLKSSANSCEFAELLALVR